MTIYIAFFHIAPSTLILIITPICINLLPSQLPRKYTVRLPVIIMPDNIVHCLISGTNLLQGGQERFRWDLNPGTFARQARCLKPHHCATAVQTQRSLLRTGLVILIVPKVSQNGSQNWCLNVSRLTHSAPIWHTLGPHQNLLWLGADPKENCHLTVKKLSKTWHSKKLTKIVIFSTLAILLKKWQFLSILFLKKCQVFGNFLTFKWQFSGGSGWQ